MSNEAFLDSTAKNLVQAFYISVVDFFSSHFAEIVNRIKISNVNENFDSV